MFCWYGYKSEEEIECLMLVISRWVIFGMMVIFGLFVWFFMNMNVVLFVWVGVGGMMVVLVGFFVFGILWKGVIVSGVIVGFIMGVVVFLVIYSGVIELVWFGDIGVLCLVVDWLVY